MGDSHSENRLDSWKAIARHLDRSVRTVRRWEQLEGLPVHRHRHQAQASVFAYASELDAWRAERAEAPSPDRSGASSASAASDADAEPGHTVGGRAPAKATTAIAVLPFTYTGPDPAQAWVSEGFTEAMISGFSKLASLRVTSRTSSAGFKGSTQDSGSIARALGVSHLLEGAVVGDGKRLRIAVRLIDPTRDDHLWSRQFSGAMDEVFDIQERIARAVVAALQLRLAPEEDRALSQRSIEDVAAWRRVVQAREAAYRWRPDALERARVLLTEALALVGENAVLCAAMGRVLLQFREAGLDTDERFLNEAAEWTRRAMAADPHHLETHTLTGWLAYARGDLATAIDELQAVVDVDHDHPDAMGLLINCLLLTGQENRARPIIEHLMAVDPLTPLTRCMPGFVDALEGQFQSAVEPYREMLDRDPANPVARLFNTWVLFAAGRDDEALAVAGGFDAAVLESTPAILTRRFAAAHLGTVEQVPLPKPVRAVVETSEMFARLAAEAWAMAGNGERTAHWLRLAAARGFANWPYLDQHSAFLGAVADHPEVQAVSAEVKRRWQAFQPASA
ncbi:MAG: tetratricopeptide repeat protein [Pseudomonadota bacterium]